MKTSLRLLANLLLASASIHAQTSLPLQTKMPAIFSDHMVLQSDAPVPVWGMAAPGAQITIAFADQSVAAKPDDKGYWNASLKPLKSSSDAAEMTVTTKDSAGATSSITIHDVLVGQVWVAGGQSNMGFGLESMEGKEKVLATADRPTLRLFNVKHLTAAEPVGLHPGQVPGDLEGKWELSNAKSAYRFSAVAYLFGAELQDSLHSAVGMISSNWGGTPIKTWIGMDGFRSVPALSSYVDEYTKAIALHQKALADPKIEADYQEAEKLWRKEVGEATDAATKKWNADTAAGLDPGPKPKASRPEPQNPDPTGMPSTGARPQTPSVSWNAMCAPLVPFAVKGALWYQGEADVSHYVDYGLKLRILVTDWRHQFNEPDMEFLAVQLPDLGENKGKPTLAFQREAQATVLDLPHTGLAVTYDVGDPGNVHPVNKIDVAHRLSLIALGQVYHQPVQYLGPTKQSVRIEGATVTVTFTNVGKGLTIGQSPWLASDAKQFPTDQLVGFALAGADGVYHSGQATIAGNTVVVTSADVPKPLYIRYAFDSTPWANLYNKDGLPAPPFRTDKQP